ncbi:taperin [Brachyhypopomus gauderio]|uniref:taperin n=1 Tax=Brachyhypopomus gauderio TaxID=698409 RepID=UPI00404210D3
MSSGDMGVLHQEAGQDSPRMPAWKREILERRKAKGSGTGAGVDSVSFRVNGETTGNSGSKNKDDVTNVNSNRTYTVMPASQHFAGKRSGTPTSPDMSPVKTKDPWSAMDPNGRATSMEKTARDNGAQESLVLQESLGPLQENPFIKLEKERKKRQEREHATRPVQHILELYGSVPGIRTIRAENIIIIESDPEYFPEGGGLKQASKLRQNGTVGGYSSLNDLLDRRGSPVTEIRAKEVVVYDTALSKSEENLSTLGRPSSELADLAEGYGRVSRMLQKFDRNYGKLQGKSRSSENLIDLDSSPVRPSLGLKPQPDVVPKCATCPQPGSPVSVPHSQPALVFQNNQSPKTKLPDSPSESASSPPTSGSPKLVSSFWRHFEISGGCSLTVNPREEMERSFTKPVRGRDWDSTDGASKPKVPCSTESHQACAETSASPTSPPLSPSFEIRPSPRPDLSTLPVGDLQARALANLRLQSRNSFTVVPKRRGAPSSPGSTAPSSPVLPTAYPRPTADLLCASTSVPIPAAPTPHREKVADTPSLLIPANTELSEEPSPAVPTCDPSAPSFDPLTESTSAHSYEPTAEKLPVTNIDDVAVEPVVPYPSPMVQRRKGNTFTVVPKRRSEPQPGSPETQEPAAEAQDSPSTPQAPYAQLGTLLKKRYPAVEEIEVIGGYLSLGRSCLSKTGSTGKKLTISFNESSLQSTFEYPSESSIWDSGEEEEDGGREGSRLEGEGQPEGEAEGGISMERIRIPRPSYTSSPTPPTSSSTYLSSYTPKHSVEFTAWHDHKFDDASRQGDTDSHCTNMSGEVMLTPADSSSLSDFSSEPALYF